LAWMEEEAGIEACELNAPRFGDVAYPPSPVVFVDAKFPFPTIIVPPGRFGVKDELKFVPPNEELPRAPGEGCELELSTPLFGGLVSIGVTTTKLACCKSKKELKRVKRQIWA